MGFRKAEFVAKTHFLLKFWTTLKINIQKREGLSNFEKPVFDLSTLNPIVLNPKKNGLRRKSKVKIGIKDFSVSSFQLRKHFVLQIICPTYN